MKILYLGDIMGPAGLALIEQVLPDMKQSYGADVVIAQAENVTNGRGISPEDYQRLRQAGVDFCTGGNWTLHNTAVETLLADPSEPIIRPANYPDGTPGLGYKYLPTAQDPILVISLLGHIVGKDADRPMDNPLQVVDAILASQVDVRKSAVIVNFHGDYSSEKVVIGHYLDGRATAVIGDHWHVPTADARLLPRGTAHISDVGMCGVLDSSLGVSFDSVIPRWRDGLQTKNLLETAGPRQINAVLVTVNAEGRADAIEQINQVIYN